MADTALNLSWFSEIEEDDGNLVGTKGILLGKLSKENLPFPKGFVITSSAFSNFLNENNLHLKIDHLISSVNFESPKSLEQVSNHIKTLILTGNLSPVFIKDVLKFYKKLGGVLKEVPVNIKLSLSELADANSKEIFSNIKGDAVVIDKIKSAWSEYYNPSYILKRHSQSKENKRLGLPIIVEEYLEFDTKIKVKTYDIKNDNKLNIIVDEETVVRKSDLKILENTKSNLSKKIIEKISEISLNLEKILYFPQEITLGIKKNKIYILDVKPLTFYSENDSEYNVQKYDSFQNSVPVSAGISSGPLRFVLNESEINKVMPGDVVVLSGSSQKYQDAVKKASAVVILDSGINSSISLHAKKLGIPAIANAKHVLEGLRDGHVVTVNGIKGEITKGSFKLQNQFSHSDKSLKTATKLFANITSVSSAISVSKLSADGIVPLNSDQIIEKMGAHPKKMIAEGQKEVFVEKLSKELEEVCKVMEGKIVVFKFSNLKTSDYKKMLGGNDFEPVELNPTLGFRGSFRHLNDKETFEMEISAVKNVREKGFTNLSVLIPLARTVAEFETLKKMINNLGLARSSNFKLWLSIETPANVIELEEFIGEGLDGISIDLHTLSSLMVGADKENNEVAGGYSNLESSVLWSLEQAVKVCQKHNVVTSIRGNGISDNPDLIKKLIAWGISSISVFPDSIEYTRKLIYQTEKSLLLK